MDEFYVHTATVEMFLGQSGYGEDKFAPPVAVPCFADGARKLVRGGDGAQIVSESTLYTYPIYAPLFASDSRVTLNGAESRVIKLATLDSGALDLPDHIAINLT